MKGYHAFIPFSVSFVSGQALTGPEKEFRCVQFQMLTRFRKITPDVCLMKIEVFIFVVSLELMFFFFNYS